MHLMGDYIRDGGEFSSSKWLGTTNFYIDKITKDLMSENWMVIFQALHRLKESDALDEQIQIGAPLILEQREALLPDNPPTPPPLD